MSGSELTALSPLIFLGATPVVMMLITAFSRRHGLILGIGLAGLAGAFASLVFLFGSPARQITPLMLFDPFAAVFTGLVLAATAFVMLFSAGYMERFSGNREEYYILLLMAAFGASALSWSTHFASLFLGFEILSVSLYALIAYPHLAMRHIEAGLKYLILAAASSAFLLFGMALMYAGTGSMEFGRVAAAMEQLPPGETGVLLTAGAAMVIVGLNFKLALVPFHWWTPDVYQGAPAPVAGFVATVSKGGIAAVLVRLFSPLMDASTGSLFLIFAATAGASMIIGNLLALLQDNVKRILAYSSIAHLGYLMVAFLSGGKMADAAVIFYLAAYFATVLGAFGVITLLSTPEKEEEGIVDYRGLFYTRPWLAAAFAAMLFSLAGMPLTAGFIGKFYLLAAGVDAARWTLVMLLIVGSAIGLFYYLRIIVAMFVSEPEGDTATLPGPLPILGVLALVSLTGLLFWLGIAPGMLMTFLQRTLG